MGLIRYSCGHISGHHNQFMSHLVCEGFSSCSTEILSWKCWNAQKKIWWRHTSVLYSKTSFKCCVCLFSLITADYKLLQSSLNINGLRCHCFSQIFGIYRPMWLPGCDYSMADIFELLIDNNTRFYIRKVKPTCYLKHFAMICNEFYTFKSLKVSIPSPGAVCAFGFQSILASAGFLRVLRFPSCI